MDPLEILKELTEENLGICGRYPKYGIAFEFRMSPDGNGIVLKWWPPRKRGSAFGKNPRLTLLKLERPCSVAELKAAAIAQIDRMIAAENARVEEEAEILALASPQGAGQDLASCIFSY